MKISNTPRLVAAICFSTLGVADAATTYVDETAFLDALATLGQSVVQEGFEDDAAWGSVRSTTSGIVTAPSITNLGITWTSNNDTSEVTTSNTGTAVHSGTWGFLSLPHGDYDSTLKDCTVPGVCGDGFVATSAQPMVAMGGWFSGTFGADIDIILDGASLNFGAPLD
ncbi:MAG: hypothetical protein U9P00_06315, partial [Pseudomonadota bacterium]|nr:hypothetical protein [Pseudomonadota bacterium]